MTVYCPICLSRVIPDEFSDEATCSFCEEEMNIDDCLTAEEVENVGCPGGMVE